MSNKIKEATIDWLSNYDWDDFVTLTFSTDLSDDRKTINKFSKYRVQFICTKVEEQSIW